MEVTLFNKHGRAVAYIAEDGETIYTWDGRAAAYLSQDQVYGWNGRQLGWYANGTIFDIYGLRTGFIRSKSPISPQAEPAKPGKRARHGRAAQQMPAVKPPVLCYGYSTRSLEDLLEEGLTK